MENYKSLLYNWVFHYNPYKNAWAAIPRDQYDKYRNNSSLESVLYSKDINTLIEILYEIRGNKENIKLLK